MDQATRTVEISRSAVQAARDAIPDGRPVIMINLLRFREVADYGSDSSETPCSGRDAYYGRYAPVSSRLVQALGARVFWAGHMLAHIVAPGHERWDDALLVEYPDFDSLVRLADNPEYQAVVYHRTAALEDSRLIATATAIDLF